MIEQCTKEVADRIVHSKTLTLVLTATQRELVEKKYTIAKSKNPVCLK